MTVLEEPPAGLGGVDAFRVLGLPYSPDLTDEDVRAAYLLRMRAVHPDNGGDSEAAAAVTAAHDALRSAGRRGELLAAVTVDRDSPPAGEPSGWRLWSRERAASPPRERGRGPRARPEDEPEPGMGPAPDAARREELWRKMSAARVAQGLPPYITDEAVLDKIADLLVGTLGRGEAAKHYPQSAGAAGPGLDRAREPAWEPSSWRREGRRAYARDRLDQQAAATAVSGSPLMRGWLRVRYGRPWWLAARTLLAAGVVLVAQAAAPGDSGGVGARHGRGDVAAAVGTAGSGSPGPEVTWWRGGIRSASCAWIITRACAGGRYGAGTGSCRGGSTGCGGRTTPGRWRRGGCRSPTGRCGPARSACRS